MKKPTEFLADPRVEKATKRLAKAIDAALADRGTEIKSLMIIAKTEDNEIGSARVGCNCRACCSEAARHILFAAASDGLPGDDVISAPRPVPH